MQPQQTPSIPEPVTPPVPTAPFSVPNSIASPSQPAPQPPMAQTTDTPAVADDGDRIEKDWITKLKDVISSTAQSPYEQSIQLTRLKSEYLQKRYGKIIKAEE